MAWRRRTRERRGPPVRSAWLAILLGIAAGLAWLWERGRQPAIGESVFLADGGELRLCGVTWGRDHRIEVGSLAARWLERLPARYVPAWNWLSRFRTDIHKGVATFDEPHLVLWFLVPIQPRTPPATPRQPGDGTPAAPRIPGERVGSRGDSSLGWKIMGPDGGEHGGDSHYPPPNPGIRGRLHAIAIDSYPRRARRFTVHLYERRPGTETSGAISVWLGGFVIRNRGGYPGPESRPEALPAQLEGGGVRCVLEDFRLVAGDDEANHASEDDEPGSDPRRRLDAPAVLSRVSVGVFPGLNSSTSGGGISAAGSQFRRRDDTRTAVATFVVSEAGVSEPAWEVRQLFLTDPGGNVSYALDVETRRELDGRLRFVCRTIPLWPDDPAWKLRVHLVRAGVVASNRVLRLDGVPFPGTGPGSAGVLETNFLGYRLRISPRTVASLRGPSLFPGLGRVLVPALTLHFGNPPADGPVIAHPMIRLLEVRTDAGQIWTGGVVQPDVEAGGDTWIAEFYDAAFPAGRLTRVSALDLTLGFPEEREFEFRVPSGGRR